MSADVYFRRDIAHVLLAVSRATSLAVGGGAHGEYLAGFQAAIVSVGLAFGIAAEFAAPAEELRLPVLRLERER